MFSSVIPLLLTRVLNIERIRAKHCTFHYVKAVDITPVREAFDPLLYRGAVIRDCQNTLRYFNLRVVYRIAIIIERH